MKLIVATVAIIIIIIHFAAAKFPFTETNTFSKPSNKPSIIQNNNAAGDALYLTNFIEAGLLKEAKDASKVINLTEFKDVESYSGYFTVNKTDNSNLFFWFFPSANNYTEDPVVLWLEGGPGSSSLYGLFNKNGPFSVDANGSVHLREYSWHKNSSILYIDQPIGAGFSFTNGSSLVTTETQIGEHLYSALTQFFTIFSELQNNFFYIAGQSYAGKYIPAIAHTIHKKNPTATNITINLQGLLIGNGLSDPINQLNYGDLLYQIGLIDTQTLEEFKDMEKLIATLIKRERYQEATYYFTELFTVLYTEKTGLNSTFNYIQPTQVPDYYAQFLELDNVRKAIHVGNAKYNESSVEVFNGLYSDITKSVADWIAELLSYYRILIFNGHLDILVGYASTENYLKKLNFSASTEYAKAKRIIWYEDNNNNNNVAGYVKYAGNLTEVLIRNAGHAAIYDQPKIAYDLFTKFINNKKL